MNKYTQDHLMNNYNQLPISFTHGNGDVLYDRHGKGYIDLYCGIAVTGLGHNHPRITKAIQDQAAKVLHSSNLVEIPEQQELATLLADITGITDAKSYFCNSGAEATETIIKLTRLYGHSKGIENPHVVIAENGFHGRTMAAISAAGSEKFQTGFTPLLPGFYRVPYNDPSALEKIAKEKDNIVAVFIEPVQGEAGILVPDADYLSKLRVICDNNEWLMISDEVQAGMGRTGKMFAYEHNGIEPDAITLAKGLGNGLPIGACVIKGKYADLFKQGSHGSTFGGNPLSTRVGTCVIQEILGKKLANNAGVQGEYMLSEFKKRLAGNDKVVDIRGKGLMLGIELVCPCRDIIQVALAHGIIFNIANLNTVRLLPTLTITRQRATEVIELVCKVIQAWQK
jgi:acetylornithine/N-succinyldiaminopimelate aminotransferase